MAEQSFVIELSDKPSEMLRLAERELSHYVPLVTGLARVEKPAGASAHRFRLGTRKTSFFFRNVLNNVSQRLADSAFRIVSDSKTTVFAAETELGLLYAAYYFLSRVMHVRWVEPGLLAEVRPAGETRAWWPLDLIEAPSFAVRGMKLDEGVARAREADVVRLIEWMGRLRLNRLVVGAGHSYDRLKSVYVRECTPRGIALDVELSHDELLGAELFADHPEFFPVVRGVREGRTGLARCASNDRAVGLFASNAVEWVRAHPEAVVVTLGPGSAAGFCECKSCRRLAPAGQWGRFLSAALLALKAEFPGRNFSTRVTQGGALAGAGPAAGQSLGVGVLFDTAGRCVWHELGSEICPVAPEGAPAGPAAASLDVNRRLLVGLKEAKSLAGAPVLILENVARGELLGLPAWKPEVISRDLLTYRALGIDGVIVRVNVQSFGGQVFNYNLFARMSWSVESAYRGLWSDLCVRYFGGHGVKVIDYLERLRRAMSSGGPCVTHVTRNLVERDWQDLNELLTPAPQGALDVFGLRYARLRRSYLYMREVARVDACGAELRRSRKSGDWEGAMSAAREAFEHLLNAWDVLTDDADSGMLDALDLEARLLTEVLNSEELARRHEWFVAAFWREGPSHRGSTLADYVRMLEREGLSTDEVLAHLMERFAATRASLATASRRVADLLDDIDFNLERE